MRSSQIRTPILASLIALAGLCPSTAAQSSAAEYLLRFAAGDLRADFDGDGTLDEVDIIAWRRHTESGMTTPVVFRPKLAREMIRGSARVIWCGDSWAAGHLTGRLPGGWLLKGRMMGDRPAAMLVPMSPANSGPWQFDDFTTGTGAYAECENANSWVVSDNSAHASGTNSDTFGLPVGAQGTVYGGANVDFGDVITGNWKKAMDVSVDETWLALGDNSPFLSATETMNARFIWHAATTLTEMASARCRLYDGSTQLDAVNFRTEGRGYWGDSDAVGTGIFDPDTDDINAFYPDVTLSAGTELITIAINTLIQDSGQMVNAAGFLFMRNDGATYAQGYYHGCLASGSWGYQSLGNDAESTGNKQFSNEQCQRWVDVTTRDRDEPHYLILHVADENLTKSVIKTRVEAIITRWNTFATNIGIGDLRFILVGGYMHFVDTGSSQAANETIIQTNNEALYEVAQNHANICFVSLYEATGRQFFIADNGGSSGGTVTAGTNANAQAWLTDQGYDNFPVGSTTYDLTDGTYAGNLIDDGLHIGPGSGDAQAASGFFADVMRKALDVTQTQRASRDRGVRER